MIPIEVEVAAAATVPSSTVPYANVRPSVSIRVRLEPGEDVNVAAEGLQATVDQLLLKHILELERTMFPR